MSFIRGKIEGFRMRLKSASLGITYLTTKDFHIPDKLKINGRRREFKFNHKESDAFVYEFSEICIRDCYQLLPLKDRLKDVRTIVDIGANQGIFLVAARQNFPKAAIFAYEPNPNIYGNLSFNAASLESKPFLEAVTKEDCSIELSFGETDLHTTAKAAPGGNTKGTAFSKIIQQAGGTIDILKMDCEGGEWDLFEDVDSWRNVNSITMEYHLWAKPGYTEDNVKEILQGLGFEIIFHNALSDRFGLITAIKKPAGK